MSPVLQSRFSVTWHTLYFIVDWAKLIRVVVLGNPQEEMRDSKTD